MKSITKLLLVAFLIEAPMLAAAKVYKQAAQYLDELFVNSSLFSHKQSYEYAQLIEELWVIDSTGVDKETYHSRLQAAYEAERAQEEEQRLQIRKRQQDFIIQERIALLQKLLGTTYNQVLYWRAKIVDERLQPFVVFTVQGITDKEQLAHLDETLLPEVKKIILEKQETDLHKLQSLANELEPFPERLQQCYYDTIRRARHEANDTKLLKELLEMIS